MEHARLGKPADRQELRAGLREPVLRAAADKSPPPRSSHPFPKDPQMIEISRCRVEVEVALHDRLEPLARLRHRVLHAQAKLPLDLLQFRPHTLATRLALYGEVPLPSHPADVREAQEVERLGLAFPSSFLALFGMPPELDPARLVEVAFQPNLFQPSLEIVRDRNSQPPQF